MKNTMNFQNYGVAKMSTREMEAANGGGTWWRALILAVTAAHGETCNGSSSKDCTWVKGVADHMDSAPMYN